MESYNYADLLGQENRWRVVQYKNYKFDFIKEEDDNNESCICPQNGFLHCKTIDNQDLLINVKESFKVHGKLFSLSSGIYVRGRVSEEKLRGIRFNGGILSNLYFPEAIEAEIMERGTMLHYRDDSAKYSLNLQGKDIKIIIASHITESQGVTGTAYTNNDIGVEILFEEGLSLSDVIPVIIAFINMCQFMTNRKNIGFKGIQLLEEYTVGEESFISSCADIYYNYPNSDFTEKKWIHCLSFKELGDTLPNLFKSMYLKGAEKTDYYPLDYLPEGDKDAFWFDEKRIKAICTAVEKEAARQGIESETIDEFEELKKRAKEIVKEYKNKEWMSDRTYNMINSDIKNWDYSAFDKYMRLFHKYENLVIQNEDFNGSIADFEEAVAKLIQYRNGSTHGVHLQITPQIVDTAYNLLVLIYCSRLDYLGIKQEIILEKIRCRAFC